ncbi:MAG: hypothetical protein OQK19_02375 [Sedimenticola sp.]|nr:hypothetical protein [Sedimenticola sp.]
MLFSTHLRFTFSGAGGRMEAINEGSLFMITPLPSQAIEPFVRECLGCACPAEVFAELESDIRVLSGIQYQRLLAGQRLLVYLILDEDCLNRADLLSQLHRQGVAERNSAGYNRLRIVLPAELGESIRSELIARFADLAEGDQKVHLHFVPQERLGPYRVAAGQS